MPKWVLEFDYPLKTETGKIKWLHSKQKMTGSSEDAAIHKAMLEKYGNMRKIQLKRVV